MSLDYLATPGSSNIAAVQYDDETRELTVEFQNGASYKYREVPPSVMAGFREAGSVGQYFFAAVKNRYSYERL